MVVVCILLAQSAAKLAADAVPLGAHHTNGIRRKGADLRHSYTDCLPVSGCARPTRTPVAV